MREQDACQSAFTGSAGKSDGIGGLPHWLMIVGAILVLFGLSGFALSRNKAVEADPGSPPDDVADAQAAERPKK
jgi:hypothetical protein